MSKLLAFEAQSPGDCVAIFRTLHTIFLELAMQSPGNCSMSCLKMLLLSLILSFFFSIMEILKPPNILTNAAASYGYLT